MADPIGAIGSNDDKLAALRKKFYNPAEKAGGHKAAGAFVAYISPEDFTKTGQVPNWNAGNVPMTT